MEDEDDYDYDYDYSVAAPPPFDAYDEVDFGDLSSFFERQLLDGQAAAGVGADEYMTSELAPFFAVQPSSSAELEAEGDPLLHRLLATNRKYQRALREQLVQLDERLKSVRGSQRWLKSLDVQLHRRPRPRPHRRLPPPPLQDLRAGGQPAEDVLLALLSDYAKAIQHTPRWSDNERAALARGVRHQNQSLYLERLLTSGIEQAAADPTAVGGGESGGSGNGRAEAYANAVRMVQGMSQRQLEFNLDDLDWSKIAAAFVPSRSPEDCRIQWTTQQHPLISLAPWGREEGERLEQLVGQLGDRGSWIAIAEQLGTNRTAWQCLAHYRQEVARREPQRNTSGSNSSSTRKWTPEEDRILYEAVATYGSHNDWWVEAEEMLEGRNAGQILHRWTKALDPSKKTGRWTTEEDAWLLAAVQRYGRANWSFIREFVPHRTDVQCRERYMNVLMPDLKHEQFSTEEDRTLREAVERLGEGHWAQIAALLPNRTDNHCRRRWLHLKRETRRSQRPPPVASGQPRLKAIPRRAGQTTMPKAIVLPRTRGGGRK